MLGGKRISFSYIKICTDEIGEGNEVCHSFINQSLSKRNQLTDTISLTWELGRNADSDSSISGGTSTILVDTHNPLLVANYKYAEFVLHPVDNQ